VVKKKDYGADSLLALNGDRYFIDDKGDFEVIFKVMSVAVTPERPHGLKYTLGKKLSKQYDHKHIGNKVFPYTFEDALSLVADFWEEVDKLEF
jgi:hypothetical protein